MTPAGQSAYAGYLPVSGENETHMYSTEIRFVAGQFVQRMNEMRTWLDSRHFEPSVFRYDHVADGVVIHVEFAAEAEAVEFAGAFGGAPVR